MVILLVDRNNYLMDDFISRISQYISIKKVFYDEIDKVNINSSDIVYTTPSTQIDHKLNNFLKARKTINDIELQNCFISKPHTDNLLMSYGFSIPTNTIAYSREELMDFIKENRIVILKQPNECGGAGHFILTPFKAYAGSKKYDWIALKKGKRLARIVAENRVLFAPPFYVQKFLPPDNEEIWRAYIVGGRVKFLSTRQRQQINNIGDYIINVCRGAEYRLWQRHEKKNVVKFALKIASRIKIDVGTIDILLSDGQPYALEIDCDGIHTMICREFYHAASYDPSKFDLDFFIAEWLKKKISP